MKNKINLVDAVFSVLRAIKTTPLDIAINDTANSMANSYDDYMTIWNFLTSLVW